MPLFCTVCQQKQAPRARICQRCDRARYERIADAQHGTVQAAAQRLGCHSNTIRAWRRLWAAGRIVEPPTPQPTRRARAVDANRQRRADWLARYERGESLVSIADSSGYAYDSVRVHLWRARKERRHAE
jgi:transposase-like protein